MNDLPTNKPEKWEIAEMIRASIESHEIKKEGSFVSKTEFEYVNKLRDQAVNSRLGDLEKDSTNAQDRNKWLFRLVVGAVILSFIPIVIALLSQAQGSILK